jgi:uncharacterized protein YeaO (DUF488 family)
MSKEKAAIYLRPREIAPSIELRRWYGHDLVLWDAFPRRYRAELDQKGNLINNLKERLRQEPVPFVFAVKDKMPHSAVLPKEYL